MTEYNEGDTVRATKGFEKLEGVVTRVNGIPRFQSGFHQHFPGDLARSGYTVEVIEKAAPPLPTEQGIYSDRAGSTWRLDSAGWHRLYDTADNAEDYAPFTRLEPVADTAKKVLERVDVILQAGGIHALPNAFSGLAKEFGIQS